MRAFVISLPRGEENPTSFKMIIKSGPCFNLFGSENMLINGERSCGIYTYSIEDRRLVARHIGNNKTGSNIMDDEEWEVHGIGWIREGMHDMFVSSNKSSEEVSGLRIKTSLGVMVGGAQTSYTSHIFKSHFTYRENKSDKEKKLLKLFNNIRNSCSKFDISAYFKEMVIGEFSLWYDLVGTDRMMSMAIGYLMSYRNNINYLTTTSQSSSNSSCMNPIVRHAIQKVTQSVSEVHPDFLFSLFSHHGEDSDIFVHAGQNAILIGIKEGFFGLEGYCNSDGTLDKTKRYYKGYCSSNIRNRLPSGNEEALDFRSLNCLYVDPYVDNSRMYANYVFTFEGSDADYYEREAIASFKRNMASLKDGKRKLNKLIELCKKYKKIPSVKTDSGDKESVKEVSKGFHQWVTEADAV